MEKAFALKHTTILDAAEELLRSGYQDFQKGKTLESRTFFTHP